MNKTTKQLIKQLQEACKPVDPASLRPGTNAAYLGPKGAQRARLWFALFCADVKFSKECTLGIDDEIYRLARLAEKRIAELKATLPIRIPPAFYADHADRSLPTPEDLSNAKNYVLVRADDPALPELLNDAEYYASPYGPDADYLGGLKASAKATVRAIRDVIGWDGAEPEILRLRKAT